MSRKKVKISIPPNPVKAKAKVGGAYAVDATTLQKAEEAIVAMTPQYLDWVKQDLVDIEAAYNDLINSDKKAKEICQRIFQISHDMKGQGGTFGFDLITTIADQLCQIIENVEDLNEDELEAIRIHIEAMKLVINMKMRGTGGNEGSTVLSGLEQVLRKLLGQAPPLMKN